MGYHRSEPLDGSPMFTGIVEEVGRVVDVQAFRDGRRIAFAAPTVRAGLALGDSIAVDGVCQTIVALEPDGFSVEAIGTTLSRTTLGAFRVGRRVNLERALALGDRLGGHLVQGHVDAVGYIRSIESSGEHVLLDVWVQPVVADVSVLHGSIAINGVSLTINALPEPDVVQVALIPYTLQHTTFPDLRPGDPVNLEGDMIGKFVVQHLRRTGPAAAGAR
jgi:riboflavin synthase